MRYSKSKVVIQLAELTISKNPFWFNSLVIFFDIDNQDKIPMGMLSFYNIFIEQLDIKLFKDQFNELVNAEPCFFFLS